MMTDPSRVIVTSGECGYHSVHTTLVHHRDFPEIWGEGATLIEGSTHLAHLLARALEGARSGWHRAAIEDAIADLGEFIDSLDESLAEDRLVHHS